MERRPHALRGKHLLKTGMLIEHAYRGQADDEPQPRAPIPLRTWRSSWPAFRAGSRATRRIRTSTASGLNTLFGFYLQDDYRVTSKVTLNLGLRHEFFTVPKDKNGLDAYLPDVRTSPDTVLGGPFVNPSLENVAPARRIRVGCRRRRPHRDSRRRRALPRHRRSVQQHAGHRGSSRRPS